MKVFLDVITVYNQLTLHKGHFPESSWWVSTNQLKSFKNRSEDSLGVGGGDISSVDFSISSCPRSPSLPFLTACPLILRLASLAPTVWKAIFLAIKMFYTLISYWPHILLYILLSVFLLEPWLILIQGREKYWKMMTINFPNLVKNIKWQIQDSQ